MKCSKCGNEKILFCYVEPRHKVIGFCSKCENVWDTDIAVLDKYSEEVGVSYNNLIYQLKQIKKKQDSIKNQLVAQWVTIAAIIAIAMGVILC